jgi:hypothetical protein
MEAILDDYTNANCETILSKLTSLIAAWRDAEASADDDRQNEVAADWMRFLSKCQMKTRIFLSFIAIQATDGLVEITDYIDVNDLKVIMKKSFVLFPD